MFTAALQKIKKITSFPGVVSPPQTENSFISVLSVHVNIALIIALYAFLGDVIIAAFSSVILLFTYQRQYRSNRQTLNKLTIGSLLAFCFFLFMWRFNGSTGGQSWMGLLMLLITLKALESKNNRDHYVTTLMLFFLAAVIFAYNNSAIAPIILAIYSISILSSMMLLSQPTFNGSQPPHSIHTHTLTKKTGFKVVFPAMTRTASMASKLFVQALPVGIILFFLFPRIQGSFGFLPSDNSTLKPSLPNGMNTGSFSSRSTSNQLAFRVNFLPNQGTNAPPNVNPDTLYWRVKTFSKQEGFNWSMNQIADNRANLQKSKKPSNSDNKIRYLITHQATNDTHIPSLDSIYSSEVGIILENQTLLAAKGSPATFQYEVVSTPNTRNILSPSQHINDSLNVIEQKIYLETSFKPKTKTTQLLNTWLNEVNLPPIGDTQKTPSSNQAKQLALLALRHFREQPFSYHLLPPSVDRSQPIEDFLFNTQSGYCEHYSSTFSTLMRWLKVPTRIVAGFQGADYNDQGEFYEVRYSSAHAWSEIWTSDDGWIKTDPTAAVAPERIEFGMEALLALMQQNNQNSFNRGDFSLNKLRNALAPSGSLFSLRSAKRWLDSANHSWDKWIVNYDFEQQTKLLKNLGLTTKNQYLTLTLLIGIILTVFSGIIIWLIWPKRIKRSALDASYFLFKKKVSAMNIDIPDNEGPLALSNRLRVLLPDHQADIQRICQYYIENKYNNDSRNLAELTRTVKAFQPKAL